MVSGHMVIVAVVLYVALDDLDSIHWVSLCLNPMRGIACVVCVSFVFDHGPKLNNGSVFGVRTF